MIKYALFYIKIEYAFMYKNIHAATAASAFCVYYKSKYDISLIFSNTFSCAFWKENIMFGKCNMKNQVINNFVKIE